MALILAVEAMVLMSFGPGHPAVLHLLLKPCSSRCTFIGGWWNGQPVGGNRSSLLYNLFGGLIMLAAVVGPTWSPPGPTSAVTLQPARDRRCRRGRGTRRRIGPAESPVPRFPVRIRREGPLWPFHTWLFDAAVAATPASAVLMMAIVDKVGNLCDAAVLSAVVSRRGVVFRSGDRGAGGGRHSVRRDPGDRTAGCDAPDRVHVDLHFGFIILGIFAMTAQSQAGATLVHGQSRNLHRRTVPRRRFPGVPTRQSAHRRLRRVQKVAPVLAGTFLIAGLATLSLPGLGTVHQRIPGAHRHHPRFPIAAVVATGALVLAAIYILWTYQRMMGGPVRIPNAPAREGPGTQRDPARTMRDMLPMEKLVIVPMLVALVALGVYPKPVLDTVTPAVQHTVALTEPGDSDDLRSAEHRLRALSPMLIVLGAAVVGVLLEAVLPRAVRFRAQLGLALVAIVAAFAALVVVASTKSESVTTVSRRRPRRYGDVLQGTVLLVSLVAVAFMGERRLERVVRQPELVGAATGSGTNGTGDITDADMFTSSGASVPGSDAEYEATRAGGTTTEVFPLALFAVGGMMLFGACGDLLTMFVALEVMSLPLYLLCGLARRRRLISQEAALKYFLLGAFASAFFLFGAAFAYGATGSPDLAGDQHLARLRRRPFARRDRVRPPPRWVSCSKSVPYRSIRGFPTCTRAPPPPSPDSWPGHQVAAFGGLLRVCYLGFGEIHKDWGTDPVGGGDRDHADRRDHGRHPVRHQTDARLFVHHARRFPAPRSHRPR